MSKGTVNQVMLVGRLGSDPEVKYTASGTAVAKLSLATVESVKKGDNWEDVTEWHRIVVWGKQAEFCGNYMAKGKLVYVAGRIQTTSWEDSQGQKRYTTEIIARDIQLMGGKSDGESSQSSGGNGSQNRSTGNQSGGKSGSKPSGGRSGGNRTHDPLDGMDLPPMSDDDIPF